MTTDHDGTEEAAANAVAHTSLKARFESWRATRSNWLLPCGAVVLAFGVWSVFHTGSALGAAVIVVSGALLLTLWAYGDRIVAIRLGGGEVRLSDILEKEAQEAEDEGLSETAERLREVAAELENKISQLEQSTVPSRVADQRAALRKLADYYRGLRTAIETCAAQLGAEAIADASRGFDYIITKNGSSIGVEATRGSLSGATLARVAAAAKELQRLDSTFRGVVIIVSPEASSNARTLSRLRILMEDVPHKLAEWRLGDNATPLQNAFGEFLDA